MALTLCARYDQWSRADRVSQGDRVSKATEYPWCVSQRRVRARDDDRDAAIEIVEAAWSDGQLTRDEYDRRVDRLLRAPTLRDLEVEIADLQPEGVTWQPPSSVVVPLADAPKRAANSSTSVIIAVALAGVVVAGLIVRSLASSAPPSRPTGPDPVVASSSLLTPASFMLAREELDRQAGSDAVYSAVLTRDSFAVVRPTSATGDAAVRSSWNGEWTEDQLSTSSGERLSLGLVSAEAISTILADARDESGKDVELTLLFQIEHRGDQRVCITATVSGDTPWTARYDCRGQLVGS